VGRETYFMRRAIASSIGLAAFLSIGLHVTAGAAIGLPADEDAVSSVVVQYDNEALIKYVGQTAPIGFRTSRLNGADLTPALPDIDLLSGRASGTWTEHYLSPDPNDEADTPMDVAFTADGSGIIVAHRDSRNLVVFDAHSQEVSHVIALSGSPNSVAVTPDGTRAVTANLFEHTLSVVDLVAMEEIALVDVAENPKLVRITPDGARAVVGSATDAGGVLTVVDVATATVLQQIDGVWLMGTGSFSTESGVHTTRIVPFVIGADNRTCVVASYVGDQIQLVDLTGGTVNRLPASPDPYNQAIAGDGQTVVICHRGTDVISVVDIPSQTITKTLSIGTAIYHFASIAVDPSGTKAIVGISNNVVLVNLVEETTSGPLCLPAAVSDLAVTADGQYCVVGNGYGSLISFETESVVAHLNDPLHFIRRVAVSPVEPRTAMIDELLDEILLVATTNGADGHMEAFIPSGPAPEPDKARRAAISPDGSRAVIVNNMSDDVSVIDLGSRTATHVVPVGERPSEVKITPDGTRAVVASMDSNQVSIVELETGDVDVVSIVGKASQVEISPDGTYAYVAVLADDDGVWRIDLSTLTVAGPLIPTGEMGLLHTFFEKPSGMTLSHDGETLVTCNTFDDNVSIIDVGTWSEIQRVSVGTQPVSAVFSPDDSVIYVSNYGSGTVFVVEDLPFATAIPETIPIGSKPWELAMCPDGSRVFVEYAGAGYPSGNVAAIDIPEHVVSEVIPLGARAAGLHVDSLSRTLYAATSALALGSSLDLYGSFFAIDAVEAEVSEEIVLGEPAATLVFNEQQNLALIPAPVRDKVILVTGDNGSGVPDQGSSAQDSAMLTRCAPNPMRTASEIFFSLTERSCVELAVYDVRGRMVRRLAGGLFDPGQHARIWDGRDARNRRLPSGVYFTRLKADEIVETAKLVLLR
jgi:YVTN family beta-propeller protein